MFQLKITEKNNAKYSCEVNRKDGVDKKEFRLVIEREYFNILTFIHAYTDTFKISASNHIYQLTNRKALTVFCCVVKHIEIG